MNLSKIAAGALLLVAVSAPAAAFTVDGSGITVESQIWSSDVYVDQLGPNGEAWGPNFFSGSYWSVDGIGDLFQICADQFDSDGVAPLYNVQAANLSTLGQRGETLTILFSNVYPEFQNKVDAYVALTGGRDRDNNFLTEWNELAAYSTSLQTLGWTIMAQEQVGIDLAGAYGIDLSLTTPLAASLIGNWVTNINSGAWTANPAVKVYHAASSDSGIQDRIWVEFAPAGVPEPATWAMLIAGFGMVGFVARRRESMAKA